MHFLPKCVVPASDLCNGSNKTLEKFHVAVYLDGTD